MKKTSLMTPSIICISGHNKEKADLLNNLNCKRIHIDVCIGRNIHNFIAINNFKQKDRELFAASVDFHLFDYRKKWKALMLPVKNSDHIIVHIFPWMSSERILETLLYFLGNGCRVAVALDIDSPIKKITPFLSFLDCIMIMGIKAGGRGLPIDKRAFIKIHNLRKIIDNIELGIDGGVNDYTFKKLVTIANIIVVGGIIFNKSNIELNWRKLLELINKK